MPLLDSLKNLLLKRFVAVLAIVVLGSIPLLHGPRVFAIVRTAQETRKFRKQAMDATMVRPTPELVAEWDAAVPSPAMMEPAQFMVSLRRLARGSGCRLGEIQDAAPAAVQGAEDLLSIETTIKVIGTYGSILRFTHALRQETRVLAVTRMVTTAEKYPQLTAEISLRRYLRQASIQQEPTE